VFASFLEFTRQRIEGDFDIGRGDATSSPYRQSTIRRTSQTEPPLTRDTIVCSSSSGFAAADGARGGFALDDFRGHRFDEVGMVERIG